MDATPARHPSEVEISGYLGSPYSLDSVPCDFHFAPEFEGTLNCIHLRSDKNSNSSVWKQLAGDSIFDSPCDYVDKYQ